MLRSRMCNVRDRLISIDRSISYLEFEKCATQYVQASVTIRVSRRVVIYPVVPIVENKLQPPG